MSSSTSVSASEVVIGDVAEKFKLPCQRVHAVTVTVCRRPDSNRRWLPPTLKATDLDHSATTLHTFQCIFAIDAMFAMQFSPVLCKRCLPDLRHKLLEGCYILCRCRCSKYRTRVVHLRRHTLRRPVIREVCHQFRSRNIESCRALRTKI